MRPALLNGVELSPLLSNRLFKLDELSIKIFLNVLVVLQESLISLISNVGHLLLMIVHHLFKVLLELSVGLVERNLHPLLQSGVVHGYLVLKVLNLLAESAFDGLELLP